MCLPRLPILLATLLAALANLSRLPAAGDDERLVRQVADGILAQTTRQLVDRSTGQTCEESADLPLRPEISVGSKFNAWFYQTWLLTEGMRRVDRVLPREDYRGFGERNLDFLRRHLPYFERQHAAGIRAAPAGDGALSPVGFLFQIGEPWHLGMAPLAAEAADRGDQAWEPYLGRVAAYLARAPRRPDGVLLRGRGRVMADDPYMVVPYLMRRYAQSGRAEFAEEAVRQVLGTAGLLLDPERQLYRHAWELRTGQAAGQFWGRANGWMVLAHVELLARLPASHPRRTEVLASFARHAAGLREVQDPRGGWHQVLDHPESWIETSGTGMFTYGLARGANEGWLDRSYLADARRGWEALRAKVTADGDVIDVCASTDVGDLNYYLKRPRLRGDLHGFGPFLLAGAEIIAASR